MSLLVTVAHLLGATELSAAPFEDTTLLSTLSRESAELKRTPPQQLNEQRTTTRERFQTLITEHIARQVISIMRRDELSTFTDSPRLGELIKAKSKRLAEQVIATGSVTAALSAQLTQEAAMKLIDQWLGVKRNEELDELYRSLLPSQRRLSELNVRFKGRWSKVEVLEEQSLLVRDEGGVSQGDLYLDRGELLTFALKLHNQSRRRLFSSSIWLTSKHECLWVPEQGELVLPELEGEASKDKQGEVNPNSVSLVNLPVYVSQGCPANTPLSIELTLRDTHRRRGEPQVMEMSFTLEPDEPLLSFTHQLDRDLPGHSDGASFQGLERNARVELSTQVRGPHDAVEVYLDYTLSEHLKPLIAQESPIASSLVKDGKRKGLFWPNDDLDLTTISETKAFDQALMKLWEELGIQPSGVEGPTLLAFDVLVKRQAYAPSWAASPQAREASERRAQKRAQKSAQKRSTTQAQTNAQAQRAPLTSDQLVAMLREHVSIEPLPAAPQSVTRPVYTRAKGKKGEQLTRGQLTLKALKAVSGYQVVFDEASFKRAYQARVSPQQTTSSSAQPTQASVEKAEERLVTRFQLQRHYLALNAQRSPLPVAKPKPKPKPKPQAQPKPRPRFKPRPRKRPQPPTLAYPTLLGALYGGVILPDADPLIGLNASLGQKFRLTLSVEGNPDTMHVEGGLEHWAHLAQKAHLLTSISVQLGERDPSLTFGARVLFGEALKRGALIGLKLNTEGYLFLNGGFYF